MGSDVAAFMSVLSNACEGLFAYFILGAITTATIRFMPRARRVYAIAWRLWLCGTLGGFLGISTAVLAEFYDAGHPASGDASRYNILLGPIIGLFGGIVVGTILGAYLAKRQRNRGATVV